MKPLHTSASPGPLDWAAEELARLDDVIVSLRALWLEMYRTGVNCGMSLDIFVDMLRTDERFELLAGFEAGEDVGGRWLAHQLGFEGGSRIKLAAREFTPDIVIRMLRQSTQAMLDVLESVWVDGQQGDPQEEQRLLMALTRAQRMKCELDSALADFCREEERGDGRS